MSCFNGTTGGIDAEVSHTIIFQTGTIARSTSTPVLNAGNRKQITGFDLTGATSGFTRRRDDQRDPHRPCPEGSFSYMNLDRATCSARSRSPAA